LPTSMQTTANESLDMGNSQETADSPDKANEDAFNLTGQEIDILFEPCAIQSPITPDSSIHSPNKDTSPSESLTHMHLKGKIKHQ